MKPVVAEANMKRRDFLGRLAQAIAALGVADAGWLRFGDRYAHALAQSTGRKLALLVGINQYPSTLSLGGCLTDVAMQRELLVHRFGFNAADVLTLTDLQATRQQIETAFLEHLTQQAKSGDTVVFHFSGYGRRVFEGAGEKRAGGVGGATTNYPLPITHYQLPFNSLVCADGEDFLDETLWLLLRSLPTKQIATFLDTSFGTPGKVFPGNLRVRSLPQTNTGQVGAAELAFQQQLQQDFLCKGILNRLTCGNIDTLSKPTPTDSIPGVVMAAASPTQGAIEAAWNGFSAGLFTYALTQHLWEATPATTVQVSLSRVSGTVEQLVGKEQQPQVNRQKTPQSALTNYLSPDPSISADGVVMAVEDKKIAQLWLAGLPPTVLAYLEVGSKLNLVPLDEGAGSREQGVEKKRAGGAGGAGGELQSKIQNPKSKIDSRTTQQPTTNKQQPTTVQLQVRSRNGLVAKAQVVGDSGNDSLQVGQLVQEAVRVLPRNIRLTIALDPSLERIERVDATSAFAAMPFVSLVTTGEQLADYVFGRVSQAKAETPATSNVAAPSSRYGLFTLDRQLIPNTSGEFGEAVKVAVQRLSPKLQTLVAAKIWRLTTNDGSSRLNVKATLETIDPPGKVLMQRETLRSPQERTPALTGQLKKRLPTPLDTIPSLPIGSHIQYRVQNHSDRPVYLLLLGLDTNKNAIALYCTQASANSTGVNSKPILQNIEIAPGETAIVPQSTANFTWTIHKPTGLAEHQLIFSSASFTEALAAMANTTKNFEEQEYIGALSNPLEVVQAVMRDLQAASATIPQHLTASSDAVSSSTDTYAFDVNNWASLSFVYQVV